MASLIIDSSKQIVNDASKSSVGIGKEKDQRVVANQLILMILHHLCRGEMESKLKTYSIHDVGELDQAPATAILKGRGFVADRGLSYDGGKGT